jgi:hypothetical protein
MRLDVNKLRDIEKNTPLKQKRKLQLYLSDEVYKTFKDATGLIGNSMSGVAREWVFSFLEREMPNDFTE